MSNVAVFNFKSHSVRTTMIAGEPWFVASDVCSALTIGNVSDAVARLDVDETTLATVEGGSSNGLPVNCLNESGLYSLILTSRKPEAKVFKKWVTSEVLPSIRKTGSYAVQLSPMEMVIASAQAIMKIEKEQAEMKNKLSALEQRVENFNGETGYRTVTAFLSMRKIKKSLSVAKLIGMQCTSLCKELGITVGEVPDERFGKVNSYPIEVLEEILAKDIFNKGGKDNDLRSKC